MAADAMPGRRCAIVTGATSGIGEAVARALAAPDVDIILCGRDRGRAALLVDELEDRSRTVHFESGDIADPDYCNRVVDAAAERFGRLDALVNAAGVIHRADAVNTSDAMWTDTMGTNVNGVFYMSRAAVPLMRRSGGGSIVNIASTVGLVGCPGLAAYCASKGAVIQLTRAMAIDHARENIRVNAVCPGAVDTPMLIGGYGPNGPTATEIHARNVADIPQRRVAEPREVAALVRFLAGEDSQHITGAAIPIDGGYTAI